MRGLDIANVSLAVPSWFPRGARARRQADSTRSAYAQTGSDAAGCGQIDQLRLHVIYHARPTVAPVRVAGADFTPVLPGWSVANGCARVAEFRDGYSKFNLIHRRSIKHSPSSNLQHRGRRRYRFTKSILPPKL